MNANAQRLVFSPVGFTMLARLRPLLRHRTTLCDALSNATSFAADDLPPAARHELVPADWAGQHSWAVVWYGIIELVDHDYLQGYYFTSSIVP
jgi:hypothetical protein